MAKHAPDGSVTLPADQYNLVRQIARMQAYTLGIALRDLERGNTDAVADALEGVKGTLQVLGQEWK